MRFPPCLRPFGPAPPTSAGRSALPATPLRQEQKQLQKQLRGGLPSRPQATPQSSALRLCRPPLRYALSTPAALPLQGWGYPSACSCYPPPSPGGVRHVHAAFQRGSAKANAKEEAPMNTQATTATVTPFTQNLKQRQQKQQTAKEVIAANVQALIEQLERGHSEGLTAYLLAMGKFHNYSFGNIWRLHGRSRTQPGLPECMRGTSLAAGSRKARRVSAFSRP